MQEARSQESEEGQEARNQREAPRLLTSWFLVLSSYSLLPASYFRLPTSDS